MNLQKVHSVKSGERGGRNTRHHEVVIFVPPLDAALNVRESSAAAVAAEEKADMLYALVEFCQELQSVVPM